MSQMLNDAGMDLIFRNARTHNAWTDKPVSEVTLRALYTRQAAVSDHGRGEAAAEARPVGGQHGQDACGPRDSDRRL